jgi:methylenetetrahydrofolate dehydrogenase (NADP+)/methenyltetrahydrofolate cyclohydrolase/formyltetrahydrofolate synthetase
VLEQVDYTRDVDGLHSRNFGNTVMRGRVPNFYPCTPLGCIALLDHYNIPIQGKRAVVIGRSDISGTPTAALLQKRNATVTVCHR